jgi:peptidoglycan/LPS O-acetylase OafA/YrhL
MFHQKKPQINSLIGLRFFAALSVVSFHFARPTSPLVKQVVGTGFIGVTLFFILSGFILTYTYVSPAGELIGSKKSFFVARLARVYPMYLVGLILFSPIILIWGHENIFLKTWSGIASLLLVQTWLQNVFASWNEWNPPGWSLSVEALFYLTFPFIVPYIRILQKKPLLSFCFIWLASMPMIVDVAFNNVDFDFFYYNPIARLPEFLLGILAGTAWTNRKSDFYDKFSAGISIVSLCGLAIVMALPFKSEYLKNGTCAPMFALLISSLACQRGILSRLLSLRLTVALGAASYSLYILHWPLWIELRYLLVKFHMLDKIGDNLFLLYLIVASIASYVCFRLIEDPGSRLLRRAFSSQQQFKRSPVGDSQPAGAHSPRMP